MKKIITISMIIIMLVVSGLVLYAQNDDNGDDHGDGDGHGGGHGGGHDDEHHDDHIDIMDLPMYDLTEEQIEAIKFMYQEEKLARDVYNYLDEKWNLQVFNNIKKSEQNHMDEVKVLLDKYELGVYTGAAGEFSIEKLQKLYEELIEKGSKSVRDALEVGKSIEELDIKDLKEVLKISTPDMEYVFKRLLESSYKHLEAFNRNLDRH